MGNQFGRSMKVFFTFIIVASLALFAGALWASGTTNILIYAIAAVPVFLLGRFFYRDYIKAPVEIAPSDGSGALPFRTAAVPVVEGSTLNGVGASVEIRRSGILIKRQGKTSFFVHGIKGDKLIPFKSMTAVQLKEPGKAMSGYIQFSVLGGIESTRGIWDASKDENTVLFTLDQLPEFLGLHVLVENRLCTDEKPAASHSQSSGQEIATLAELLAAGHLSPQEFSAQKAKVLAR